MSLSSCYLQASISSSFNVLRNGETKRRRINSRPSMACLSNKDLNDDVSNKRRAVLLVGVSILPLLELRAQALGLDGSILRRKRPRKSKFQEGTRELPMEITTEESEVKKLEENRVAEPELNKPEEIRKPKKVQVSHGQEAQGDSRSNPFLAFINGLGVIGAGVLGALYALVTKDKKSTDEILESIKIKLQEKEAAISLMEKDFESKLLKEREERTKQLKEAKEQHVSLTDRLNLANSTITCLGHELNNEKRLIEKLKVQIDSLRSELSKAREEKMILKQELKEKLESVDVLHEKVNLIGSELSDKEGNIQNLSALLAEKETEFKNLNTTYEQTKEELGEALSEIEGLKEELRRNRSELESNCSAVDVLNAKVSFLSVERDNSMLEFGVLEKDYTDLKLSSESKAVADAKLLVEREKEIGVLKEKLELAMNDASENKVIAADLNREKENLERALEVDVHIVKNLKEELRVAEETLVKSRSEASSLFKQLSQSRNLCIELESEVSRVKADFYEAKKGLQATLDEAKQSGEVLVRELANANELLKKSEEKLQIVSHELTSTTENRDTLQRELIDVYKKAETLANDLKEEKSFVSSLKKELHALEDHIVNEKEARKSLETDLEEATKSLDDANRNILALSGGLERANGKISSLEDEKMVLYKTLTHQKNTSREARENMEDARSLVMTLSKERDSFERRAKKLVEELAYAKGEILRLRSQIHSSKVGVKDQKQQDGETEAKISASARKSSSRRKKGSSQ